MHKRGFIKTYLLSTLLAVGMTSMAAPTTFKAKLDSASLLMGKQVAMQIEIVQDSNVNGYIPINEGDTLTDKVEIVGWRKSDTTDLGNNRVQINKELILQSFDSGLYTLPPVLYVVGKDTFRTNKLTLKVVPVQVDSLKNIHDYKTVQKPNTKWTDFLPDFITDYWWAILIGLLLLLAGIYMYIRHQQGKSLLPPILPKKQLLPPYEEAMGALAGLKSANLWQSGQEKEYYTQLTDILRRYICRRFEINAMEMTSSQLLLMLTAEEAAPVKDELRKILEVSDFVKFAKMRPLADENEQAFASAVKFIEETKPVEIVPPEKQEDGKKTADKKETEAKKEK